MYTRWSIHFFEMSLIVYYTVRITINSFFFVLFKLHSCFKLVKKIHQMLNAILFISPLTHSSAIKSTFVLCGHSVQKFPHHGRKNSVHLSLLLTYFNFRLTDKTWWKPSIEKNKSVRNTKRCGVFKYLNTYKLFNDLTSK